MFSFSDTVTFRVPWLDWPHPFLTMPTQQIFDQLLIFVSVYQHAKTQFIPSVHSSDTVNFRDQKFWSPETRIGIPICDHAQPKNFQSTLNFCGFLSTC